MSESVESTSTSPAPLDRSTNGGSSQSVSQTGTLRGLAASAADLADFSAMNPADFLERLCNDQVRRWRAGQRVPAETYLALYPNLADAGEAAFELIYGEFLLREELGEPPLLEEFRWRFPQFARRLERQLDLHGAFASQDPLPDCGNGAVVADGSKVYDARSTAPGFKIVGELGRGGMGAVYKAWQESLKRVVALKVIKGEAYADSAASARFQAEAEAAARFQHPNIVQVFEVGEHEGLGYLVLEYMAGGGLDRRLAGLLQDSRDSAHLIETLARAIHYAHERGIVHRDLKPANVLLTEDGVPKISDFGLAKLLERDQGLTQSGDILGTPSYMAPEQTRGLTQNITPATDVYSLGAILYEMLTGRPPFKGTTPLSTMEQVANQEPLSPGKLQRHTPRDLEVICLRCLEKDPRRRYASARELADDVRRFLDHQAIRARPTPAWERAWKWARRRPGAATAAVSILIAAALIVGGSLYYNTRLRAAALASQKSARAALHQRNLALQAFKTLVYGVQEKLGRTPATRSLRQGLLEKASAGLDEVAQGADDSGAADLSQAVAHQKLGDIFRIIGRSEDARRHYDVSRQVCGALLRGASGDLGAAEVHYQTFMGLGLLDLDAQHFRDARANFQRAVATSGAISMVNPAHDAGRRGLIEAYFQVGRADSFLGESAAAEISFRKMHDLAQNWTWQEPGNHQAYDLLAASYRKLADLKKLFVKDFAGAQQDYLSAIAIGRDLVAAEPDTLEFKFHLAIALDDLAGVVHSQRQIPPARNLFEEAARLFQEVVESDSEPLEYRMRLLHTKFNLASLERDDGQFDTAAALFRKLHDQFVQLEREGQFEHGRIPFTNRKALQGEVAFCETAQRALANIQFARSQPPVLAARLLRFRARELTSDNDQALAALTSQALCTLNSQDPDDLYDLARDLCRFVSDLTSARWASLPGQKREALTKQCTDRAASLLILASDRGFADAARLTSAELHVLSERHEYQALVGRLIRSQRHPSK
jgi:eukaryotic-like serine/threonine-protein kinase